MNGKSMKPALEKMVVETGRIIVGAVFVCSGFVKSIDPWGSAYKIQDYLNAFGLDFFNCLALPASFLLFSVEFGIGISLLLGVYRKINTAFALIFMAAVTPLTLYSAITNIVTDCGCFGDALRLTNWETFFKNLPLLLISAVLFARHKRITPLFTRNSALATTLWAYLFIAGVGYYCVSHLPILDFRPYKVGANIPALMEIPENAEPPVFDTRLIYSKNGTQREFTIDDYPGEDSTWTFVASKTVTVKKGYEPPVQGFSISAQNGDDITDNVLSDKSYTFLLVAHKLEETSENYAEQINDIYDYSVRFGYKFYALTASLPAEIAEWTKSTWAEYPICTTDGVVLKTIIRSNPGLLLLKNGTIINKWANGNLPDLSETNMPLNVDDTGKPAEKRSRRNVITLLLIFLTPLFILFMKKRINTHELNSARRLKQ
ncbi:MAG: DoxX family protein [Dysgonamonadaceae bacterium]|jgi:uncharacterized membrane protein YphA (DoxX/SURF4 family)|nr:DoxX family protein [Dysgonamonadaceae bacterium]